MLSDIIYTYIYEAHMDHYSQFSPPADLLQKPLLVLPTFAASVQSVSFSPSCSGGHTHLAVGLEDGSLSIIKLDIQGKSLSHTIVWEASQYNRHSGAIRRLAWQPAESSESCTENSALLASCGEDHAVHIYSILLQ